MFQMMGVFAEFERAMIAERVRAGLRRAISEGKTLGRPRIAADVELRISAALKARKDTGDSVRKIAARLASIHPPCTGSAALSSAWPREAGDARIKPKRPKRSPPMLLPASGKANFFRRADPENRT